MTDVTAARTYRPGAWFGIFGEHATVLLPPSEKARVAMVWAAVDEGAGFDVVLDALISEGLRDLPGFVLVSTVEDQTKVVIRGRASAWFTSSTETVEVSGTHVTTWAERSFTGVTSIRLVVGSEDEEKPAGGGQLPIVHGLVRVSEVSEPADGWSDLPRPVDLSGAPSAEPEPIPKPEPEPEPIQEPEPESELPPTEAALPPTPDPASPIAPPLEHDGDTQSGQVEPLEPEAPAVAVRPVARLVFSSGDDVEVDRAVLVGRAPEGRRFTSGDQPRLITVPSPAQEISSTHLEIRPGSGADHGSAVVTDLGSTNGTFLVQPGLPPEDLQAGTAVQLIPGAILDLGDGVTIQVINP